MRRRNMAMASAYTQNATDENGLPGTYSITGVTQGFDVSLTGQVYVDTYYDMENSMSFMPISSGTAVGTSYLGSEYDYIITSGVPEYYFGGGIYEADYEVILPTANAYDFTFTYGGNDAYTGTVYAESGYFYYVGYTQDVTDENGQTGTYSITGMTPGYDLSLGG